MATTEDAPPALRPLHARTVALSDALHRRATRRALDEGWQPSLTVYPGYGSPRAVRVLGRLLLTAPDGRDRGDRPEVVRGWRSFLTVPVRDAPVVVEVGGEEHVVVTDRGGFVDASLPGSLEPGWQQVVLRAPGAESVPAPVRVIGDDAELGVISDIDDTVMVTALPRPFLAAWNTFVLDEHARNPVPGMAVLYERLTRRYRDAPVLYLSTGAWNVAPTLTRFLHRHLYPRGPLLLTDWGPTPDRWFRSGRAHKEKALRRLADEFPHVRWLLVGDDGQHDEAIYEAFARERPGSVAGVAIRHLSPTESVLAQGLPAPQGAPAREDGDHLWVSAPDGAGLARLLRQAGLL
ncbi:phosphatase domain-containing protein [Pseudokineococcus basanitobsidens]|uniref:Phosphatase domain-containing protein n=1 Tax=Pseudokineococcus basanitobsidens TaxID=1926649 RepID=A0ABU8RM75_9ACTN